LTKEHKVTKELRERKENFDAASLRQACTESFQQLIKTQRSQFERLGMLTDEDSD
jgi:isoleucyl-tRNA synthetase